MTDLIVSRFGGDAAANANAVRRAAEIIRADPARRYIIVSAPGTTPDKIGITDLLYMLHSSFNSGDNYREILAQITDRFKEIVDGLGMNFNVNAEVAAIEKSLKTKADLPYIASRGEYITAMIFAEYLGWPFADASKLIFFDSSENPDISRTFSTAYDRLSRFERAVIPSFYGTMPDGKIRTFKRGDCDTAATLIACSVRAGLLEKWSDQDKVYSADPEVIPNPELVRHITYREAVVLNYIGINIIKDNNVFMLEDAGISLKISSIFANDDGMLVSHEIPTDIKRDVIICISGQKNFSIVNVKKYGINKEYDFGEKLFGVFSRHRIACQHYLTGVHSMSVIVKDPVFDLRRPQILNDIRGTVNPESVTVDKGLSLIVVAGEGMSRIKGIFSRIFLALASAGINVNVLDQGADDLTIILGVDDKDYERAIKALYKDIILKYKGE